MANLSGKGERTRLMDDRAWTGLDHETAVRMSGRAYRPGKVYDRPQLSERRAGKPGAHDEGQK